MMDMSEIEKRLQVAGAYRKILDTKLLDPSDVNEIIESEVKEFVHGRLEVLLGVRPAENPSVHFTAMEIMALKMLAKKLTDPKKEEEPVVAKPAPKPVAKKVVKKAEKPTPVKVEQEASPEPLPESVKEPEEMNENIFFEGNRKYEMIEIDGKPFAKDVTKQVTGKGGVAMPPVGQLGNIMQQLAHQELAAVGSDPITAALIQASMG